MKNILQIVLGIVLGGGGMGIVAYNFILPPHSSKQPPLILKDKLTIEREKLEKRKLRWQNAKKCLRAMYVTNGRVKELCSLTPDIFRLEKDGGFLAASFVVDTKIEEIRSLEDQLNDRIIDKLPVDEPNTAPALLKILDVKFKGANEKIKLRYIKANTCILEAQLGKVIYNQCIAEVNAEYDDYKKRAEASQQKLEFALEYFRDNYKPDP